jgi:hypothetical protein
MLVCLAVINLQTTNKKAISQYLLKSIAGHQKVNRMKELNAVEVQDINGGVIGGIVKFPFPTPLPWPMPGPILVPDDVTIW